MLLCTDVGNTNIKFAVYDGDGLLMKMRFKTNRGYTADDYAVELYTVFQIHNVASDKITGSIISSVVPEVTQPLEKAVYTVTGSESLVVGPGIKTGLDIRIDNPASVGSDIICCCVAIKERCPCPAVLIGLGTATTILYMNENKAYCGGAILPGIQISLDALSDRCALLPSVNLTAPKSCLGTNTVSSINCGVILGNAAMIDGMIDRFESEVGRRCSHIATGGFASTIIKHCKHSITVNDDLVLEGLKIIYKKNTAV